MRIAHIADVHIRGLSRHDEYRTVFDAFAQDVKKNNVDHVYVGGDIFHTKTTGISPEVIDFMTWWFKRLSQDAVLHLTLGNHDGNISNLNRQDAISPIISILDDPRIKIYKKSGVYQFHPGYNWCVFSIFDEPGWENVKPVPGEVNIACYHGSVRGARTESGWELAEGLTVDFFKDYTFGFLGDIHKTQYLGYREFEIVVSEDELKNYPGAEVVEVISK